MTQFRVELGRLAKRVEEISRVTHAGDVILVDDEGRILGESRLAIPVNYPVRDSLRAFRKTRRTQPPIDNEVVAAVEEAGSVLHLAS